MTCPLPATFSVFLSYASEDRAAADRIAHALRAAGIDVWFDVNELRGGDTWEALIRQRIKSCTFFVALLSATTEARAEGYFRREWRFAIERSHDMADDRPFIIPVALSEIPPDSARVPQRFLDLQWIQLPAGSHAERLVDRLQRLQVRIATGSRAAEPVKVPPLAALRPAATAPRRPLYPRIVVAAAIGVAAVAAAILSPRLRRARPVAEPTVDAHSLAVLPFINRSSDPKDEYLSDGLSEELLATLSRHPALRVVARTSCFAFKGRNLTVQQIAAALHVASIVEGSVRHEGTQVKIAVELVNAATGFSLWSGEYAPHASEIFDVQSTVARDIVARLLPDAAPTTANSRPTTRNLDAYDAFLRGRAFQAKPPAQENIEQAANYFRQATELDPNFALAWARYGIALMRLHSAGFDDANELPPRARQALERALAIDPALPEAHYALADYYTANFTSQALAEHELLLAHQRLPNDPDILTSLAATSLNTGRKAEAVQYIRRAALFDPQNGDTASFAALILDFASRYPEAMDERERAFRISGWPMSLIEKATVCRNWQGDLGLALKTLALAEPSARTPAERAALLRSRANFLRAQHDYAGALAAIAQIEPESVANQFYVYPKAFLRAVVEDERGDATAAHADFEQARLECERYRDAHPATLRAHTVPALVYAGLNRDAEAEREVARCLELVSPIENPYVAARTGLRLQAMLAARANRLDEALAIVRAQAAAGFWKRHDLLLDPDWEHLRKDPRFLQVAKTAEL